jgi:hypothetical protein
MNGYRRAAWPLEPFDPVQQHELESEARLIPKQMLSVRRIADNRVDFDWGLVDQQEIMLGSDGVDLATEQRVDEQAVTPITRVPGALGLGQVMQQRVHRPGDRFILLVRDTRVTG